MFGKKRMGNYGTYQVTIKIIEARHLVKNSNPMVIVKVGNQKRKTDIREKTDCPYYNEYFVFEFTCDFNVLMSTTISISVYLRNSLRQKKFYGGLSFEVATVWDQPNHEYYHKWAMLTNPKDHSNAPRGYVKCNISVMAKGDKLRTHPDSDDDDEDDIEGKLLLPIRNLSTSSRQKARYVFSIYRADGLPNRKSNIYCGNLKNNINPYIQISFAGMKGETSLRKCTFTPRFNENIIFKEMFPSLSNRVRIAVKDKISGCNSTIIATHLLNLTSLSYSSENGFLPTYGPSFIHLYDDSTSNNVECSCSGKCRDVRPIYRGRVLISLKTEIDDPGSSSGDRIAIEPTFPISEKSMWNSEEYLLVGIIYDVCMIDRYRFMNKAISFEISFGNAGNTEFSNNIDNNDSLMTLILKGVVILIVLLIPFGCNKPCMFVKSCWPNLEWRLFNSNILTFIANYLEEELGKLEALIAVENGMAYEAYNGIIGSLKFYCMHYLKILNTEKYHENGGTTILDKQRVNYCREFIQEILKMIKINGNLPNNNYIKIAMIHAYKYLQKIREACDDPQHGFPDVFIWMISGKRRVALTRLKSTEIIYSEDTMSCGTKCGQRINLFIKNFNDEQDNPTDYSPCNIEIFIWLGNIKYSAACWSKIPAGYKVEYSTNIEKFPKYIEYTESTKFQLRAHIFQGRFDTGMDSSGLMDPFIQVIFRGCTLTTQWIQQSLAPVWDETLVFPPIEIHGTSDNIKKLPPKILVEAFDYDRCGTKEFCGRCISEPVVKLSCETYSPPILTWHKFQSQKDFNCSILAAFELIEINHGELVDPPLNTISENEMNRIYNLPDDIKPKMKSHRFEIIFWGVRDMKKINCISINKPKIILECSGIQIVSEVIDNYKKYSNFNDNHVIIDLDLPELDIYYPPITIKAFDSRSFGNSYVGVFPLPMDYDVEKEETKVKKFANFVRMLPDNFKISDKNEKQIYGNDEDENHDWWSKYYASLEEERYLELGIKKPLLPGQKPVATLKIYPMELELQPEFCGFQDKLTTFELSRGKKTNDPYYNGKNYCGKFKGKIAIYPWPSLKKINCRTMCGHDASFGLLTDYPSPTPVKITLRVYIVKAINLHPNDALTGKSDPYIRIKLGKNYINDKKNYIPNQLNPIFGKCFEMEAQFPRDHTLIIQIWDYDSTSSDDLIGETKIDIENRYYSNHRGTCGISKIYCKNGYNAWRDREKPTSILESLCKKNNLEMPEYTKTAVVIGKQKFLFTQNLDDIDETDKEECMALNVLHQWQNFPICGVSLVPEHVERRSLLNPKKPGLEQGKLELWIDMLHSDDLPPKPPIDIKPQLPIEYELRVIIWNTEDIPLVDSQFLSGEKSSDIYVKGWILYEDHQKTDIHYNSLNGEGNFNWRFVFRFMYSKAEQLIIVKRKLSILERDRTEQKLPCKLNIQVWDSDHFSADDFLGSLTIDLSRMPRGCANSKNCTLKVTDQKSPTVNLFKVMRTRAWWPLTGVMSNGTYTQAGKVEMEMTLVPVEEANEKPVGKGRSPPSPLPPPDRPDTSFSWFRNPWKACCFVVCRYYKWRIAFCSMIFLLIMLLVVGIYAVPGYLVKKILNV
ncbi:otoferlin [Aphidius gifuensis]|uniref:otoferlin n=1 Tax=Aphidius gifuensis TaxID=684658 RepID=UPI001CDC9F1A|nr:otoferlin [Aphidius gifuensis]